jgi:hypothetical protein
MTLSIPSESTTRMIVLQRLGRQQPVRRFLVHSESR